jgi:Cof subfamily protein (haloacid dehalogenase superfamily)
VALDLDGTAVRTDGTVSERLKRAIRECHKRRIRVILATGRMPQSAVRYWQELGLSRGPLIAYQGALVMWVPDGEIVSRVALPDDAARRAVDWALSRGLLTQVYVGRELWVSREDARARRYIDANHIPALVRTAQDIVHWPEPPIKLLLQGESAVLDRLRGELEALMESYPVRIFKSQADYLEVVSDRVGKSVGLRAAAALLKIPREQVLAVGDAENDLDMLQWAGFGVAMGQAPADVKTACDAVTGSVDEDGAAQALERWVLQMPAQERQSD